MSSQLSLHTLPWQLAQGIIIDSLGVGILQRPSASGGAHSDFPRQHHWYPTKTLEQMGLGKHLAYTLSCKGSMVMERLDIISFPPDLPALLTVIKRGCKRIPQTILWFSHQKSRAVWLTVSRSERNLGVILDTPNILWHLVSFFS